MFSIMSRAAKSAHDENAVASSGGDAQLKTSSQNTSVYHVWIFRGSILAGVLLILVDFIFIKFPLNVILFVVALFLFLGVSFWYHVMVRRKKREQQSSVSSSRFARGGAGGGDNSSFVDVPLEQFNDYDHYNGSDGHTTGLKSSHNSHMKHQHLVSA